MTTLPDYLKQHEVAIHNQDVVNHEIIYNPRSWERRFANTLGWEGFRQRFSGSTITRGELFDLEVDLDQPESIRTYFIAVMVWGYGLTGYGPYRTQRLFAAPDFDEQFRYAYSWICRTDALPLHRIEQAYDINIKYFGPAFFTKLFYFIGRKRQAMYPLILDAVVAKRLEQQLGLDIARYAKVGRRYSAGYVNYVSHMHAWAQELNCEADQIEMFLFGEQP